MNWYNLIFFHVFKRYYKNGRYKNDIPWLTASGIVGMSSLLYLFMIAALVHYFVKGEMPEINNKYALPLGITFLAFNWFWFIGGNKYLGIFDNFKERYLWDKFTETLSWVYVFGAYFLFILMILSLKI